MNEKELVQIGQRLASEYECDINAIEVALNAERERCAKIAEADLEISDAPAARRIADEIRGSKH